MNMLFFTTFISVLLHLISWGIHCSQVISNGDVKVGQDAEPHEAQYFAYVERTRGICGGVLIGRLYVLTSAQCVTDPNNEVTQIRLAYYSPSQGEIYLIIKSAYELVSESYTNDSASHDVALIKLHEPADLLPGKVKLISLPNPVTYPENQATYDNQTTRLYGFELEGPQHEPLHLQTLDARVVPYSQCSSLSGAKEDALCVERIDGNSSAGFYGELGSPLVQDGVVIGVNSRRGPNKDKNNRINIYARVDYHAEWIQKEIYRPH